MLTAILIILGVLVAVALLYWLIWFAFTRGD